MATPRIPKHMWFSLDGRDFGRAYGTLNKCAQLIGEASHVMAHWSETEGGGKFTEKVSIYYISQLKRWISGEDDIYLGRFPVLNKRYEKFKNKYNNSNSKWWYLFGNVHDNISVIWRGKHGRTVGIQRSLKVPRINLSGKTFGTIGIARYAMINEFGGKFHPPRPIFQRGMLKFTRTHFPQMVKAVEKAIEYAIKYDMKAMDFEGEEYSYKGDVYRDKPFAKAKLAALVSEKEVDAWLVAHGTKKSELKKGWF